MWNHEHHAAEEVDGVALALYGMPTGSVFWLGSKVEIINYNKLFNGGLVICWTIDKVFPQCFQLSTAFPGSIILPFY